jgi:hypothetical protein
MSASRALDDTATSTDEGSATALAEAVSVFLAQAPAVAGYRELSVAGRRALCTTASDPPDSPLLETPSVVREPLLLAGERGAVYVPRGAGLAPRTLEALAGALQRRGFQPTTSTLAVRLPAELGGAPRVYTLWATRAYLVGGAVSEQVWK